MCRHHLTHLVRSSCPGVFCKKVFLKISSQSCNFIKKETPTQVFPVNFAKFLSTPFFTENSRPMIASVSASVTLYSSGFQYSADLFTGAFLRILQNF